MWNHNLQFFTFLVAPELRCLSVQWWADVRSWTRQRRTQILDWRFRGNQILWHNKLPPKRLWIDSSIVLTSYADDHLSCSKIRCEKERIKFGLLLLCLILWSTHRQTKVEGTSHLKNVQTDIAVEINIGVEATSVELDLRRLERIVIGEREWESVLSSFKHSIFASCYCPFPTEYVVFLWESRYSRVTTHLKKNNPSQKAIFKNKWKWKDDNLPSSPLVQIAACV